MILTGFAGLVAEACSMAIGEFVSGQQKAWRGSGDGQAENNKEGLPNPQQAAAASALAFLAGAVVPLLAASFISEYRVRIGAVVAAVSVALVVFGLLGAALGGAPVVRSSARVLVGGLLWL
ncbi:hypothetical protein DH2020_007282 [Rehmannia glutinosa]|uniref:Vacuolar iron transporter n=1 Tax=Rehmannia glutinosa TaxID=99300 RepID=A0ABR0TXM5_REHGL